MDIWLISDTHFNHERVKEYESRPDNFDELIWKGLEIIPDNATLIHLGDICIGGDKRVHDKLSEYKFKKILVRGNHDSKSNSWYLNHGWDFVCRELGDKLYGKHILFTHIPFMYDKEHYDVNIHGHLHRNRHRGSSDDFNFNDRVFKLISVEFNNYKPIRLNSII